MEQALHFRTNAPFASARVGNAMKAMNCKATVNSKISGVPVCSRSTSSNATIENHCHRDRRNLSMRFGRRTRSPNPNLSSVVAGTIVRIHATAKNPAKISSTKIVFRSTQHLLRK
jgi:hypothetical protein